MHSFISFSIAFLMAPGWMSTTMALPHESKDFVLSGSVSV
jgi:hypothetical protein